MSLDILWNGAVSPWWGPFLMLLAGIAIGAGALLLGKMLRPRNPSAVKLQAYECGNDPVGDAHQRIPIRYYTVAMLFLLFDAEAIFLWPWAVAYKQEGSFFLFEAIVFIAIVGLGYAYAWYHEAFEWKKS